MLTFALLTKKCLNVKDAVRKRIQTSYLYRPVFQFTLVFKGLFYTLIAMCSLNGRDISKITQDRFKHNFAWMHKQIDGTWRKPLLDARLNRGGNKETVYYLVMV